MPSGLDDGLAVLALATVESLFTVAGLSEARFVSSKSSPTDSETVSSALTGH